MPNLGYERGIPNGPDNPSNDQPDMKINNDSNDSIWTADHFGFRNNKGGRHKQVTLTNESAPGIAEGDGALYASLINSQSWPVWQNSLGSTVMLSSATSRVGNGYASLPGKILIQWGSAVVSFGTHSINFNTNFAVVGGFLPIVVIQAVSAVASNNSVYLVSTTNASFTYNNQSSTVLAIHWHAIGPI